MDNITIFGGVNGGSVEKPELWEEPRNSGFCVCREQEIR